MSNSEQWKIIRDEVNNSYDYNDNWKLAITVFENRLNENFFNPLKGIIKNGGSGAKFTGEGFAILTVLCAIIECFAAFKIGRIHKFDKQKSDPTYYYTSESKSIFVDFLTDKDSGIFEDNFFEIDDMGNHIKNSPFSAVDFYSDVRCGLMHEARTKGNWTINAFPKKEGAEREKVFIESKGGKIKIYRTVLYYKLVQYLQFYTDKLREDTAAGSDLRRLFARKLDHLFEIPPDPSNFDWWVDK